MTLPKMCIRDRPGQDLADVLELRLLDKDHQHHAHKGKHKMCIRDRSYTVDVALVDPQEDNR